MKKYSLTDYALYWLARALGAFFRLMPTGLAFFIGRRLGQLAIYANPKRARVAYANLKMALGKDYSRKELKQLVRRTYANIGEGLVEVFLLPKMDEKYIKKYFEFENFDCAHEVLKQGRGLIILTAHFGTWEASHAALPYRGLAFTGIAREQKPYLLNELLHKYRESKGCRVVFKGLGIKEALKALKSKVPVGMLVDQDAGKKGIFVKLFGKEASWNPGVMEMALRTNTPILPGFSVRKKGPYIKFWFDDKTIVFPENVPGDEKIKQGFRQYVACLEDAIRKYPDQWLWQHKRWKSSPVRNVVILNDARTGHLRQSEAVVEAMRDAWEQKGLKREDIRVKILEISKGGPKKDLMSACADIVISCGSFGARANLALSKDCNARSVVIMKPSFLSLRKFDLAIVPRHDDPPKLKNVVVTEGALNLIDKKSMERCSEGLLKMTGALRPNVIGILIGGASRDFNIDKRAVDAMLDEVIGASRKNDCDILLTTSRRTPGDIGELIKKKLFNNERCRLLLIANEANVEGAVQGILGLSDIAISTKDSISMMSEAASSGAYAIVLDQKGDASRRHKAFLENLSIGGYIKMCGAESIGAEISNFFKNNPKQRVLDDKTTVREAVGRVL